MTLNSLQWSCILLFLQVTHTQISYDLGWIEQVHCLSAYPQVCWKKGIDTIICFLSLKCSASFIGIDKVSYSGVQSWSPIQKSRSLIHPFIWSIHPFGPLPIPANISPCSSVLAYSPAIQLSWLEKHYLYYTSESELNLTFTFIVSGENAMFLILSHEISVIYITNRNVLLRASRISNFELIYNNSCWEKRIPSWISQGFPILNWYLTILVEKKKTFLD